MSQLNAIPQVVLIFAIICFVIIGCCLLAITSYIRRAVAILQDWHEEWLYSQGHSQGHPKPTKEDMRDPAVRMAHARKAKKQRREEDDE